MQEYFRTLPRMRTIKEAAAELKLLDSNTAITEYHIRQLIHSGIIPTIKAGKKYLINLDTLIEYLQNPTADKFKPQEQTACSGIRRIV